MTFFILEIAVGVFYGTITSILLISISAQNDLVDYLTHVYSKPKLLDYLYSLNIDIDPFLSKKHYICYIINCLKQSHNIYKCDTCYHIDPYTLVHKCHVCTYHMCVSCFNKLHYPVLCPQCRIPCLNHYEITNAMNWFINERNHNIHLLKHFYTISLFSAVTVMIAIFVYISFIKNFDHKIFL